jgi:hypothetical protein
MMYVSSFVAESAVVARDVAVERLDSTPSSFSTITTVVLLQLSLALFLWALFRDAEPKSDGPAEEKKPQMKKALSRTSSSDSTASTAESQTAEEKSAKPDLTVEVPTQAESKPELPSPYTSYQEKQLRQNPSVFYGFCVEYAATGTRHQDRAPCRVTLVDFCGKLLLDAPIWVPSLHSPLTLVTGLTRTQIAQGMTIERAREAIRNHCGPRGVLVGQGVEYDVSQIGLSRHTDYLSCVDTGKVFQCLPSGSPRVRTICLEQLAVGLLQVRPQTENSVEKARISLQLLMTKATTRAMVDIAREHLAKMYTEKRLGFRKRPPPRIDGVCMGIWSKQCNCSGENIETSPDAWKAFVSGAEFQEFIHSDVQ